MGALILDRGGIELKAEQGAIIVYEKGRRLRTVPLALIERVIAHADVTLSSGLLGLMAEYGVGFLALNRRGSRLALMLGRPLGDARLRLAQCRMAQDEAWRSQWCGRLLRAKVHGQWRTLAYARRLRPDLPGLLPAQEALAASLGQWPAPDVILPLASWNGWEGAAAAIYFRAYTQLFAPELNFFKRNRRPPRDPVNAVLSLGYTLLHAEAAQLAHAAGFDPLVGMLHQPAPGRDSLASDLMEPLRPRLDLWVWQLFRSRRLRPESFGLQNGACLLGKAGRRAFYEAWEFALPDWRRGLNACCRMLKASLRTQLAAAPELLPWDQDAEIPCAGDPEA